jgi:hypothetical protein
MLGCGLCGGIPRAVQKNVYGTLDVSSFCLGLLGTQYQLFSSFSCAGAVFARAATAARH